MATLVRPISLPQICEGFQIYFTLFKIKTHLSKLTILQYRYSQLKKITFGKFFTVEFGQGCKHVENILIIKHPNAENKNI